MFLAPGFKLTDEEKRRRHQERIKHAKETDQRFARILREIADRGNCGESEKR